MPLSNEVIYAYASYSHPVHSSSWNNLFPRHSSRAAFSGGALLLGHVNISRSLSEIPLYLVDIGGEA